MGKIKQVDGNKNITKLEKLGFKYVENLGTYQATDSVYYMHDNEIIEVQGGYGCDVVQIELDEFGAMIYMTDIESEWCRKLARKAITALK